MPESDPRKVCVFDGSCHIPRNDVRLVPKRPLHRSPVVFPFVDATRTSFRDQKGLPECAWILSGMEVACKRIPILLRFLGVVPARISVVRNYSGRFVTLICRWLSVRGVSNESRGVSGLNSIGGRLISSTYFLMVARSLVKEPPKGNGRVIEGVI